MMIDPGFDTEAMSRSYLEGLAAYKEGSSISHNPYNEGSQDVEFTGWEMGWESGLNDTERVAQYEKEVNSCLNYGGIFHDGGHTTKTLELAFRQGDVGDEVSHMRRLARALHDLANAVEDEAKSAR